MRPGEQSRRSARDIDRKLRATVTLLGTKTIKDLAAAFRRVNPATPFDVTRAHKWIQGRARPRQSAVYEDWAAVLDVARSGAWIAESDFEDFLETVCARHDRDPASVEEQLPATRRAARVPVAPLPPAGTYACYSHAWSPYFSGRLIRGEVCITQGVGAHRLFATCGEHLPTGRLHLEGPVTMSGRGMYIDLAEPEGDGRIFLCLLPPRAPSSVLAGLMCGVTFLDPDSQPSVTRVVMVRLQAENARLRTAEAYLAPGASIADDLRRLGLEIADCAEADRRLLAFLSGGPGGGLDQIAMSAYRSLVELFDPIWLTRPSTAA